MFNDSSTTASIGRVKNTLEFSLKNKYGIENDATTEKILKIHGLSKDNFDFIKNYETIIEKGIADTSLDANANKTDVSISGLLGETTIPVNKIVGYRYLYRKMSEMYGKKRAKFLTGELYDMSLAIADSGQLLKPYCFSIDASKLVFQGRPFGQLPSLPPNRVSSYIAALCETIHQLSNHLAGAIAIGTLFLDVAFIVLDKEKKTLDDVKNNKVFRKYIENSFQSFIHSVNHLSRNSVESPFTNISIFDRPKLYAILDNENMGWYPAMVQNKMGKEEKEWLDYFVNLVMELQNIYMEVVDRGDVSNNGAPIRFPVNTLNLSKTEINGKVVAEDEDFLNEISKKEIYRYNVYVSEGMKVSSCCFDKDDKCLVRDSVNGVQEITFEEAYNLPRNGTNFRIYHNGSFVKGKPVKVDIGNNRMFEVITSNNKKMLVTENHIHVTDKEEKTTNKLTTEDYILFNTTELVEKGNNKFCSSSNLTESQGVLIGAYLGDGSVFVPEKNKGQVNINFSLNLEKDEKLIPYFAQALKDLEIDTNINIYDNKNNCYSVNIRNNKLYDFIRKFVGGNYSYDKSLDLNCLNESVEFRRGILKGLYLTDGGNSNRIYTTSEKLVDGLEVLMNSLGLVSIIDVSDRTGENACIIKGEVYNRNYPLYCVRWYDKKTRRSMKDVYKFKNGNMYFKINSIKEVDNYSEKDVYCFEMKNEDEPYFTLPNGIITHNCRLINDADLFKMGGQVNSFGGSAISLGSHRVVTINLRRISLECNSFENYMEILKNRMDSSADILIAHRELMKDMVKKGTQPFSDNGWLPLNKMFSTFGLLGYYEAVKDLENSFGKDKDYLAEILKFINDYAAELTQKRHNIFNIEQIPAETMSAKLANIDRIIFGEEKVQEKLYANQFVPLFEQGHSLWERMDLDGRYGSFLTGGGIVHFSLGEKITSKQVRKIIDYALESHNEYFALNPVYSVCSNKEHKHTSFGKFTVCPVCGEPVEDYITRTVGFFVKVSNMTTTKKKEDFEKRDYKGID
jgi:anaerobic ribonucleoside-triphosphate reductase